MISKDEFFKSVSVDRNDRFGLLFFILNTLYCVKDSAYFYCYCYQEKSFWSETCQICVIDNKLPKFEKEAEKIRYNIPELRNYFDRVQMETIRCFYDNPFSCEAFLSREYAFSGRNWSEGTFWNVLLSESIKYDDKRKDFYWSFHNEN